jgi:hypothetical protein
MVVLDSTVGNAVQRWRDGLREYGRAGARRHRRDAGVDGVRDSRRARESRPTRAMKQLDLLRSCVNRDKRRTNSRCPRRRVGLPLATTREHSLAVLGRGGPTVSAPGAGVRDSVALASSRRGRRIIASAFGRISCCTYQKRGTRLCRLRLRAVSNRLHSWSPSSSRCSTRFGS